MFHINIKAKIKNSSLNINKTRINFDQSIIYVSITSLTLSENCLNNLAKSNTRKLSKIIQITYMHIVVIIKFKNIPLLFQYAWC